MTQGLEKLLKGDCSLEFFNEQILFRARNTAGGDSYKFLSPAAVTAAFRNAPVDSGWIPPGVIRCGSTTQGSFAVLSEPARKYPLWIEGQRSERSKPFLVPLPSLIFLGRGKDYSVWAIREPVAQPSSRLFKAPLPNVFANGSICWGANKPPRATPAGIRQAWDLFISSPFNGHAAGEKAKSHRDDVRPLLRSLHNKRTFPLAQMIATGRTLDSTINAALGGREDFIGPIGGDDVD